MKRQFALQPINVSKLTANDLKAEAAAIKAVVAYKITIYDETGTTAEAQQAEVLHVPSADRIGIAWGADATWATWGDVEAAVDMWLNDPEAWEAAN